jgi:hypothetical protein
VGHSSGTIIIVADDDDTGMMCEVTAKGSGVEGISQH